MKVLHENCDRNLANDRTLPYTAYIVAYEIDAAILYDLVMTDKQTEIFDCYWDKYREGLKGWRQSEGRVNPRTWGYKPKEEKKRK